VDAVIPLLQEADAFIRRCAVEILNTTKDPRALKALVEALDDPDWWVQERAVDALAALGDRHAVPAFLRLLQRDTPATPAVLRALGSLGDPQAIPAVLAMLPHGTPAVRKEALHALVTLTEAPQAALVQQAIHQVIQSTDSESKELAESVLRTLVTKYGERLRSAPVATSTMALHGSLLGDPEMDLEAATDSDCTPYATTVVNVSETGPVAATPPGSEALQLEPGTVLDGRYRVVRRVGRGGFGTAVLVEDMVVNEEIILKFLHASLAADARLIKGFIRELRYARKITHENVIRIYDFLSVSGAYAISMEYFPSHTLASESLPLPIPRGLNIISDICKGMSVAHQADIVHRDLKPHNILINENDLVKIVDFGLAAGVSPTDSRLTQRSARMGTPAYMAPEQVRGGSIDPRTDIYSLGVIMYELFTGTPPYVGKDPIEIVFQHVEGKPKPPREHAPDLPPALEALILKAMAVQPDDRFQSMDTLRETLAALAL
jgi:serine/threonine-protein kinase